MAGSAGDPQHHATSGLRRLAQQLSGARRRRDALAQQVRTRVQRLRTDEARIESALERPLEGQRILDVGPGPLLREARYFGQRNQVTCLHTHAIPRGLDVTGYAHLLRRHGPARLAQTLGRKVLGIDGAELEQWKRALGVSHLADPPCLVGDICDGAPYAGTWDVLVTWSAFRAVRDVPTALQRSAEALRPGGVLYVSVPPDALPQRDWPATLEWACPGAVEFLDEDDHTGEALPPAAAAYRWRKPSPAPSLG